MKTKGIVHGKVIKLDQGPGLPDGQVVLVTVEPISAMSTNSSQALAALRRAAGSWADEADELDRFLEWNRQQRKGSRPEIPE